MNRPANRTIDRTNGRTVERPVPGPYDPAERRRRERRIAWTITTCVVCAAIVVVSWPSSPESPQRTWYAFSPLRAAILAAWGAWLGTRPLRADDRTLARADVAWLLVTTASTVPLDVVAWSSTRPPVPVVWAVSSGAWVGVATMGIVSLASRIVATAATKVPSGVRRAVLVPLVATAPFVVPVLANAPRWLPSSIPASPGIATGAYVLAGSLAAMATMIDLRSWIARPTRPLDDRDGDRT